MTDIPSQPPTEGSEADPTQSMTPTHPVLPVAIPHPEHVGPYRILELLGEGGMGTVYKAEQRIPIRRIVAIKLIKLGLGSAQIIARFESERQALARMDHANVAKVLDAGQAPTGQPYFVMEYVPGLPITRFADDNRLSIKERLKLFIQVCDAISHAHTKAIIHRDIKATNVLAYVSDSKPVVKVIDFGIAKALTGDRLTDRTFNTERGQVIGTYETMSPEQADGNPDIDTRTDVYSLGVLLYELLSGAKPFDKDTFAKSADEEIRRIIREVEPPRPSTRLSSLGDAGTEVAGRRQVRLEVLTRQLRSELEWIPLMAMRKERSRRYASALQFAQDIRNYLEDRPLIARPESRAYRLKKFTRRNRAVLATAAAFAVMLGTGIGVYIRAIAIEQTKTQAALIEVRREKDEVSRQKTEADEQRDEAKRQATIVAAVNNFLGKMLSSADPNRMLGENVTVLQAIQAAVKLLDGGEMKGQPLVEAEERQTIAQTLDSLGHYDDAERNQRQALELYRKLLPADDLRIASSLNSLCIVVQEQGKLAEAEPLGREALEIARKAHPADDRAIATFITNLASVLEDQNKLVEAELLYREAIGIGRKTQPAGNVMLSMNLHNLALVMDKEGKLTEAESLTREALEIDRKALPPGHPQIASDLNNLAWYMDKEGKLAEAESLYREALEIDRKVFSDGHPQIALHVNNFAMLMYREGKRNEAESLYREHLEIERKILPADNPQIPMDLDNLGQLLADDGKLAEAEKMFQEAFDTRRKLLGDEHPHTVGSFGNLVGVLMAEKKNDAVEQLLHELLSPRIQGQPGSIGLLRARATLRVRSGRFDEAGADLAQVVALDPSQHFFWIQLLPVLAERDDSAGYRKNRETMLARFGKTTDPNMAESVSYASLLLPATGNNLEIATRLADFSLASTNGGTTDPAPFAELVKGLAEYRQGRFESAAQWSRKALSQKVIDATGDAGPALDTPRAVAAYTLLAMALHQTGQTAESQQAWLTGNQTVETKFPTLNWHYLQWQFHELLMAQILLRQAKIVIGNQNSDITHPAARESNDTQTPATSPSATAPAR